MARTFVCITSGLYTVLRLGGYGEQQMGEPSRKQTFISILARLLPLNWGKTFSVCHDEPPFAKEVIDQEFIGGLQGFESLSPTE